MKIIKLKIFDLTFNKIKSNHKLSSNQILAETNL